MGEDGWAEGWQEQALALEAAVGFDDEEFAVDEEGVRYEEERMGELAPAIQMVARARWGVHVHKPNVPIESGASVGKYSRVHVPFSVCCLSMPSPSQRLMPDARSNPTCITERPLILLADV